MNRFIPLVVLMLATPASAVADQDIIQEMEAVASRLTEEQNILVQGMVGDMMMAHACAPLLDDPAIFEQAQEAARADLEDEGLSEPTVEQLVRLVESFSAEDNLEISAEACSMVYERDPQQS